MYVNDLSSGTCDGKILPKVIKESPATAWVDGQNGLGGVIGNFCMNLAIKKAKEVGVGWVSTKGKSKISFSLNNKYVNKSQSENFPIEKNLEVNYYIYMLDFMHVNIRVLNSFTLFFSIFFISFICSLSDDSLPQSCFHLPHLHLFSFLSPTCDFLSIIMIYDCHIKFTIS